MRGLDVLGAQNLPPATLIGAGEEYIEPAFQFGGAIVSNIVKKVQDDKAKAKADSEEKARLQAALDADAAATSAVSLALLSAEAAKGAPEAQRQTAEAKAAADKLAADLKVRAQEDASSGLSAESRAARLKAAQEAVGKAATALQKAPTDPAARTRLRAAQATEVRAANAQLAVLSPADRPAAEAAIQKGRDQAAGGGGIGAWLAEEWHGLPRWGWGAGGAGALGIAWWLIRGRR